MPERDDNERDDGNPLFEFLFFIGLGGAASILLLPCTAGWIY